uniref:Cuticle protein 79, isoform B n=1 Tax=Locusta migratoria TaxID=7004 RepID=CU79B_LOCMI|nr:RecName: Full=Cuticle protein 79, isoform B; AltName: Full=LM-ACP 79B; Short=LM-79B [Locusta migratoria]
GFLGGGYGGGLGLGGYGGGYGLGGGLGGGLGAIGLAAAPAVGIAAAPAIGIAAAPATLVRTRVVPGPARLVQPPPVVQKQVIQPPPIVQTRLIEPPAQLVQGPPQVIHEQTPALIKTAVPAPSFGYKSLLH